LDWLGIGAWYGRIQDVFNSYFSVNDDVMVNVTEGSFATPSYRANGSSWSKITAGEIGSLRASDSSIVQLAGSATVDYLIAEGSASVFVSGGVAGGLHGGGTVHWSGGRLGGEIRVYGTLSVYGSNLELRGKRLTGTLADGTDIDVLLDVSEGTQARVNLLGSDLVPVPPPAPTVVAPPREQQPPWRPDVVTSAQIFLSDARASASGGPPENPVLVHDSPNESGSLYVWIEPEAEEILRGVDLVVAATTPGVVQFTDATVLNPAVTVPGLGLEFPRWEYTGEKLIEEYPVSGVSFNGFNVMKGTGLEAATTADGSGPVLFARIDYDVLGEGATDVYLMIGDKGIVSKGRSSVEIDIVFGADETGAPLNAERAIRLRGVERAWDATDGSFRPQTAILRHRRQFQATDAASESYGKGGRGTVCRYSSDEQTKQKAGQTHYVFGQSCWFWQPVGQACQGRPNCLKKGLREANRCSAGRARESGKFSAPFWFVLTTGSTPEYKKVQGSISFLGHAPRS